MQSIALDTDRAAMQDHVHAIQLMASDKHIAFAAEVRFAEVPRTGAIAAALLGAEGALLCRRGRLSCDPVAASCPTRTT